MEYKDKKYILKKLMQDALTEGRPQSLAIISPGDKRNGAAME